MTNTFESADASRSAFARAREPFRAPGFAALWTGAVLFALGQWTERLALGWFIFHQTDSAFLAAATTAAHAAPGILVGPVAGTIADRAARPRILARAAAAKATMLVIVAALVATAHAPVGVVLPLVALSGVGTAFHLSSIHTLSGDLCGAERRAAAISVVSTGQRAIAAAGALLSGVVIARYGAGWSLAVGAVALWLAAVAYARIAEPRPLGGGHRPSVVSDTLEGLREVGRVPIVGTLLLITVIAEIFGFAYTALLPAVAGRVLEVGPSGLGGLSAAAGVGSVAGMLTLAARADRTRLGWLLIAVLLVFGISLAALGTSRWYALSLAIVASVGACAALTDALQWILLQASVEERFRGRVLGAWNVAIGLGWMGPLGLGALADLVGVGAAFAVTGLVLVVTGAVTAAAAPRIRSL